MFGLDIVGIGIGLIVIYLLLSLVCTATNELVAGVSNSRARTLRKGVQRLFRDTGFSEYEKEFFDHSLIKSLAEGRAGPSYIPADRFSRTMLDLIARGDPGEKLTMDRVSAGAEALLKDAPTTGDETEPAVKQTLRVLVGRAEGDLGLLEKEIEAWFDSAMSRVSAWYRKKTQRVLLLIALAVAVSTNADTLTIVESLAGDEALRDALVTQAELYVDEGRPAAELQPHIDELKEMGVPIGWDGQAWPTGRAARFQKILGLLITAFALSLGAPFWFDMLNKAMSIRSVGRTPEEEEETSKAAPDARSEK